MRVVIAGSRDGVTYAHLLEAIKACGFDITTVISGTARGADKLGEAWAEANNITVERYPANWEPKGKFDPGAGHKRNAVMASLADAVIALLNVRIKSNGTKSMIELGRARGIPVFVYQISRD